MAQSTSAERGRLDARAARRYLMLMQDRRGIEELKELGTGRPAPDSVIVLYREAFERFGVQALWSRAPSEQPSIAQALVVARGLRQEGDMRARALAARIEDACRAAL